MRVFRVENEELEGPYRALGGGRAIDMICDKYGVDITRCGPRSPDPINDGLTAWRDRRDYAQFRFGFASPEAAVAWFVDLDILREHGFHLCAYEVPKTEVFKGGKQLVFRFSASHHMGEVSHETVATDVAIPACVA